MTDRPADEDTPPTTRRERRERERRQADRRVGDEWRTGGDRRVGGTDPGGLEARGGVDRRSGRDRRVQERRSADGPGARQETAAASPERAAPAAGGPARTRSAENPVRRRRPGRVLALAVAALVVAGLAAVGVWRLSASPEPEPSASPPAPRQQQTTFVAVATRGGDVVAGALMASDEQTDVLLVPSRLVVDVAGQGRVLLADSLGTGPDAPGQAVADVLDLRVDGSWVLTLDGLVSLVDAVGGVVVDVDVPVNGPTGRISPGAGQRLDGAQAATFAGWLEDGEPEAARLARVDQVLNQVLQGLPEGANAVGSTLSSLGEESRTSFDSLELAERVDSIAADARDRQYAATVLPTNDIPTGGVVAYGVDDEAVAQLLAQRFDGARSAATEDAARVLVQNGDGTPGLGEQARERLVADGYRYISGGNAGQLGQQVSTVVIPEDTPLVRAQGAAVAESLGLGEDVLAVGLENPTLADIVVVLGADFAAVARTDG